jgi:steroid delta-isomerase-like uncharacterized protein
MPQITEENARQMIAVVNTRNVEKVMEQYAENATFQVPILETPLKGKDAIRAFLTGNFAAFPDWTIDVTKVFVSGDETVVVNSVHGTHTGPMTGQDGKVIAPTHKRFVQDQATRVIFNDHGKVTSLRAFGNSSDLARQLGLAK